MMITSLITCSSLLVLLVVTVEASEDQIYLGVDQYQDYYDLPKLPFSLDSLEPWIDAETMDVHFNGHHASYMAKMNAALTEWRKSVSFIIEFSLTKFNLRHLQGKPRHFLMLDFFGIFVCFIYQFFVIN